MNQTEQQIGLITPSRWPGAIDPRLRVVEAREDGYLATYKHLKFIVSESIEMDGRWWIHASVSRRDKTIPTYDDLIVLKKLTIGPNRTAIQVFPPAERHIDIAGKRPRPIQVLHLWSPEDDFLPDFARGGNTI